MSQWELRRWLSSMRIWDPISFTLEAREWIRIKWWMSLNPALGRTGTCRPINLAELESSRISKRSHFKRKPLRKTSEVDLWSPHGQGNTHSVHTCILYIHIKNKVEFMLFSLICRYLSGQSQVICEESTHRKGIIGLKVDETMPLGIPL